MILLIRNAPLNYKEIKQIIWVIIIAVLLFAAVLGQKPL